MNKYELSVTGEFREKIWQPFLDGINEQQERYDYVKTLNDLVRAELMKMPKIRINSPADAVPHILNISVDCIKGEEMRKLLDERGICVSVKSACSVPNTPSRPVFAVSHDRKNALSSWRLSLSHLTTKYELEVFLEALEHIIREKL